MKYNKQISVEKALKDIGKTFQTVVKRRLIQLMLLLDIEDLQLLGLLRYSQPQSISSFTWPTGCLLIRCCYCSFKLINNYIY